MIDYVLMAYIVGGAIIGNLIVKLIVYLMRGGEDD